MPAGRERGCGPRPQREEFTDAFSTRLTWAVSSWKIQLKRCSSLRMPHGWHASSSCSVVHSWGLLGSLERGCLHDRPLVLLGSLLSPSTPRGCCSGCLGIGCQAGLGSVSSISGARF